MNKKEVLRCIAILDLHNRRTQHEFSGAIFLGLADLKEYVEGFEDPLPRDLLNGSHAQAILGGGSIPVAYDGYLRNAMKKIERDGFSGLIKLKERHPETVQDIDSLEDLKELVLRLEREHLVSPDRELKMTPAQEVVAELAQEFAARVYDVIDDTIYQAGPGLLAVAATEMLKAMDSRGATKDFRKFLALVISGKSTSLLLRGVQIDIERWQDHSPPENRYMGISIRGDFGTAVISSGLARQFASKVESHDPELAARLRELSDEVRRCTGPRDDLGDEVEEGQDSPEDKARAYQILFS